MNSLKTPVDAAEALILRAHYLDLYFHVCLCVAARHEHICHQTELSQSRRGDESKHLEGEVCTKVIAPHGLAHPTMLWLSLAA